jgi:hypothetical protein
MSSDLWNLPIRDLMLNNAQTRATHYRQQAAELRELARQEKEGRLRSDLCAMAKKYDDLANIVSA